MKKFLATALVLLMVPIAWAQNTAAGNLLVQQTIKFTGTATPPTITAGVNDYAPTGFATAAVVRLQADTARTITGLAGGTAGRMVWLTNVGTATITLATESTSSTAGNRFAFGPTPFDLLPGNSVSLWYDGTSTRWRSGNTLAAGGGGTGVVDQAARDAAAAAQGTADTALSTATSAGSAADAAQAAADAAQATADTANTAAGTAQAAAGTAQATANAAAVTAGTAQIVAQAAADTANAAETPAGAQAKADAAQAAAIASAAGSLAGHAVAADPHGDRAFAVQRANHTGTQAATTITTDATHRFVTDTEKSTWDAKQAALVNATTLAKITESAGLPIWDGGAWPGGGGGGTGTVTTVSVVTANGVSGTVATASSTPAITITLGDITPTSVAATGTVTGSNLSGTNTGDQTSVTGNAGTATALQTARTINGVSFNGTANITVPAVDQTARDAAAAAETPTGAQAKADAAQAYAVQRANHTGTQAATTITEDATHRFATDAEKTTWNAKQAAITGAATTITSSDLTASRALVSDTNGKVAVSAVTSTELGYVAGATSGIQAQITNITPIEYYASTMTVDVGTLVAGTVADLQAIGGTDVDVQEVAPGGIQVQLDATGITRLTTFAFYGYYDGGSGHLMETEFWNWTSSAWEAVGQFGTTTAKSWRSFVLNNSVQYMSSGNVRMRFRHIGTGQPSHHLYLDKVSFNYGAPAGVGVVNASAISFTPTGNLSSVNVQAAIGEVDAEKQPLDADLTSIAALTTDAFGRGLLPLTTAGGVRTYIGAGTSSFDGAYASLSGVPSTFTPAAHNQAWSTITTTPTTLVGYGIVDAQPLDTTLTTVSALVDGTGVLTNNGAGVLSWAPAGGVLPADAAGWLRNNGTGTLSWTTPSKSDVGLGSVENTALSTWGGSANLTTVGTVTSGTWNGTAVADTYVAGASTWNALVSFPGFGTTGTTAAVGNDARLSDARTPTAHNQAWSTITTTPTTLSGYGITDAPTDATITTTDVTTNNTSTTKHGWAPKLPNDAAVYLNGQGAWTTPAGGSSTESYIVVDWDFPNSTMVSPLLGTAAGGSISLVAHADPVGHPGIVKLSTGNSAGGAYTISLVSAGTYRISGGDNFKTIFTIDSAARPNATTRMGFINSSDMTEPSDGIYLRITSNGTVVTVTGVCRAGGTETVTGTTYNLTVGAWYSGVIAVNADKTVATFSILSGGTSVWSSTCSSNFPATTTNVLPRVYVIESSSDGSISLLSLDYLKVWTTYPR